MKKLLDRDKLLEFMERRKAVLYDQVMRDFGGGLHGRVYQHDELKFWKECIERGVFDINIDENYINEYQKIFEKKVTTSQDDSSQPEKLLKDSEY